MTIQPCGNWSEVNAALATLLSAHMADLPAAVVADALNNLQSPVDRAVNLTEALYATALSASPGPVQTDLATVAGGLALFVDANRFHSLGQTDRALKLANACRRLAGETVDQPPADDPAPLA